MYITKKALIASYQQKDSIYIHSDTLKIIPDSIVNKKKIFAYYDVKLFNSQIQAKCDSLIFVDQAEAIKLYEYPMIWSENAELKGDSMKIQLRDSIIDHIDIYDNASILMELDSGVLYNQISGKIIVALMQKGKLVQTDVKGSATSIYYPESEASTDSIVTIKRMGLNKLEASSLTVHLDSGEVKGITYRTQPTGVFYPMDQIKEKDKRILNFSWNPFLRPKDVATLDN